MDALDAILSARDLVAVLGREIPVRLVDISTSGCMLETGSRLESGTTGLLRVTFEDEQYMDDVRIIRCRQCEGSSTLYHVGAEFLWTTSPPERSLRRILARLQVSALKRAAFERSTQM
jgi:hypothetical protein